MEIPLLMGWLGDAIVGNIAAIDFLSPPLWRRKEIPMKKIAALLAVLILMFPRVGAEDVEVTLDVKKTGLPALSIFVVDREKNALTEVTNLKKGEEYLLYVGGTVTPRAFSAKGTNWKAGAQKIKIDGPLTIEIDSIEVPWNATSLEKDGVTYVIWLERPDPRMGVDEEWKGPEKFSNSILIWRALGDEGYADAWMDSPVKGHRREHLSCFPESKDRSILLQGLKQLRDNPHPGAQIGDLVPVK